MYIQTLIITLYSGIFVYVNYSILSRKTEMLLKRFLPLISNDYVNQDESLLTESETATWRLKDCVFRKVKSWFTRPRPQCHVKTRESR